MALCDFVIAADINGYDCDNAPVKGVESRGMLINRSDIDPTSFWYGDDFLVDFALKSGKRGFAVYQSGKTPFSGTQQEMVEGTNANTITNTVQVVVLKQDENWAEQLFALVNGEFVAVLENKTKNNGYECQVYGLEAGLHCTGAVREIYSDDNLAGWQVTLTEEGAAKGNYFADDSIFELLDLTTAATHDPETAHSGSGNQEQDNPEVTP